MSTRAADIKQMADGLTPAVRAAVGQFAAGQMAAGADFRLAQAAAISALIQELGRVIGSGPAAWHRQQIAVVNDTLAVMVREHAVLFAREGGA